MKREPTEKQKIGALGEEIASKFLVNKGYDVIDRNYRRKFGEIDVIVKKAGRIHFVEVKTVSREDLLNVTPETADSSRPEDNVHPWKLKRLSRAIQVYLLEKRVGEETEWQFDVVTVLLDSKNKIARLKILEDLIL
ncbi:MAG: YraN family protein [Patescibacteria group bacterium]